MSYRRLAVLEDTAPKVLTLDEFKAGARITNTAEDDFITGLIAAAQVMVENHVGMSLNRKKLKMLAGWWPTCNGLVLMYPPAVTVDAVKYLSDLDGTEQTLNPAVYDADLEGNLRPTISLAWSQTWPILRHHPAPVRVEYTVGYDDGKCPDPLKQGVRMMTQDLYENREAQITSQYFGERSVIVNPTMVRILAPDTLWEM